MNPLAALVDLVLPRDCGGCGAPGWPWCATCTQRLRGPLEGETLSVALSGGPLVHAAGRYTGPLRAALLAYKERGRRDLTLPLARLLAAPLAAAAPLGAVWLVPVPSRRSAARARGGDHVLRLCRAVAARDPRLCVAPVLRLRGRGRDSVGLDARRRAANLTGRLQMRAPLPVPGNPMVLVDDIVTTGATLRACRSALADQGAAVRAAVVLCAATRAEPFSLPSFGAEQQANGRLHPSWGHTSTGPVAGL